MSWSMVSVCLTPTNEKRFLGFFTSFSISFFSIFFCFHPYYSCRSHHQNTLFMTSFCLLWVWIKDFAKRSFLSRLLWHCKNETLIVYHDELFLGCFSYESSLNTIAQGTQFLMWYTVCGDNHLVSRLFLDDVDADFVVHR